MSAPVPAYVTLMDNSKLSVPQSPMALAETSADSSSRNVKTPSDEVLPVFVENGTGGMGFPSGSVITTSPSLVALLVLLSSAKLETEPPMAIAIGGSLTSVTATVNTLSRLALSSSVARTRMLRVALASWSKAARVLRVALASREKRWLWVAPCPPTREN